MDVLLMLDNILRLWAKTAGTLERHRPSHSDLSEPVGPSPTQYSSPVRLGFSRSFLEPPCMTSTLATAVNVYEYLATCQEADGLRKRYDARRPKDSSPFLSIASMTQLRCGATPKTSLSTAKPALLEVSFKPPAHYRR